MSNQLPQQPTASSGDQRRIDALRELGLPRSVLLPGDPDRVSLMASQWDDAIVIDLPRGYRAASGTFQGAPIGAVATMMGAPSLDIVFTDLARLGVRTAIRVGTCGTIREEIAPGSLIVNDAAVRLDGTTHLYVRNEFPAVASHEVTFALIDSAQARGCPHRLGTAATTGSFFVGQGRAGFNDFMSLEGERIFEEMTRVGVLNFEMEAAALLTLARLFGIRAGVICSVIANRITSVWSDDGGVERACLVAADAVRRLAIWDERAHAAGRDQLAASDLVEATLEVEK